MGGDTAAQGQRGSGAAGDPMPASLAPPLCGQPCAGTGSRIRHLPGSGHSPAVPDSPWWGPVQAPSLHLSPAWVALQVSVLLAPCGCSPPRVVAPHPVLVLLTPCCFSPCTVAGTLTKFTLVLYGTATESPSLSNQLESSGCKTLTPSQTCVGECGAGRGMGARAPPGHADPVFPQSARRATTCTRRAA